MKMKWHLGILLIVLTFLGISQQQIVPNQEIVLQFADGNIASDEAKNTIALVEKQLQTVGVQNIKLLEQDNGKLIIAYYSDFDVEDIKKALSEDANLTVGFASDSQDEKPVKPSKDYNLDVFEIQQVDNLDLDSKGYVLEIKSENDRSFNPNIYVPSLSIDLKKQHVVDNQRLKNYQNIASAINNNSHKIPEVRAGPLA